MSQRKCLGRYIDKDGTTVKLLLRDDGEYILSFYATKKEKITIRQKLGTDLAYAKDQFLGCVCEMIVKGVDIDKKK